MATAKLPTAQPALADFFGEVLGIPNNEWSVNGAITAGAAVPFSLVVNEAISATIATVGKLTTANGEILNYNAVNTGTKTFTVNARAQEGTTAAAIDNGSAVGQYLTRDQVNQLIQELIQMSKTGAGAKGADVASAAALNIGEDGHYFAVTGTTTITSIEARLAGQIITLRFDGILTLTHNATSLILQGATNLTTAAGDVLTFVSEGSGNWRESSRRLAAAATSALTPQWGDPNTYTVSYWTQTAGGAPQGQVSGGSMNATTYGGADANSGGAAGNFAQGNSQNLTVAAATYALLRMARWMVQTVVAVTQVDFSLSVKTTDSATYDAATANHMGFNNVGVGAAANWFATNANGTTETRTDTGILANTTGGFMFSLTFDGTTAKYYVNGVLKATHTTNLPSGEARYQTFGVKTSEAVTKRIGVSMMDMTLAAS